MVTTGATISGRPPAYLRLVELLMGARVTLALRVIVDKNIPDLLGDETKSPAELAPWTGLPIESLRRLMRSLVYAGVFQEDGDGHFSNTDVSAYLRSDSNPSLREMSMVLNDDAVLRGWQTIEQVLQTGKPGFNEVNGIGFFQYLAANSMRSENMARFMRGIYGPEGPRIAAGFPFGRFGRVLDVGGGSGNILADLLHAHPALKGAVFDLPRTAEVARQFLAEQGLGDRFEVIAGDFFAEVTPGYDAYFVKSVFVGEDDTKSVQLLENIRKAMPENGSVLIVEIVLQPGKLIGHPHRLIDLEMMVTLGGKLRTADEFAALLSRAGLKFEGVHDVEGSFHSIVEGSRA
jgi:hypothetical protein